MTVTNAAVLGGKLPEILTMQLPPEAVTTHATPGLMQLLGGRLPQLFDGMNPQRMKSRFHAAADATDVSEAPMNDLLRHVMQMQDGQSIRLLDVARHLRQKTAWSDADGTGDHFADVLQQAFLDSLRQRHGRRFILMPRIQQQSHLINGGHHFDGIMPLDLCLDPLVVIDIKRVAGLNQYQARTHAPRLTNVGAGFHAKFLRLTARRDGAGRV